MSNQVQSSAGMGFCGWLAILFIGLKLTGFISWSWLWVLAPIWIPLAFILGVLSACFLCGLLAIWAE